MRLFVLLVLLCTACDGFTDTGDGTQTLDVIAVAMYSLGSDRTDLRVEVGVRDGDANRAVVELTDDESDDQLRLEVSNSDENTAVFRGSFAGYRRRLELDVRRDDDELSAKLEGPGRHQIESPTNGEAVVFSDLSDDGLNVEWTVDDGLEADRIRVELEDSDVDAVLLEDEGEFDFARATLELGDETIEVERINEIELSGGVPGSTFEIRYSIENNFVIVQ